jgi:hypothetical protein
MAYAGWSSVSTIDRPDLTASGIMMGDDGEPNLGTAANSHHLDSCDDYRKQGDRLSPGRF